jgi:hypothetical protein
VKGSEQRHRPGRHAIVLAGLISSAVLIAVLAVVFAQRRSPASRPSLAQAQSVLDTRAKALLGRDRAAFGASLASTQAARQFRANELATFDNLAQVPLASWTYRVVVAVNGPAENATARSRYGTPVLLARVDFSYALRDVDPAPATYQLYLSFVRESGRVRLAGDADMTAFGGASWHGPWDFGPIVVQRGAASLVLAHPDRSAELGPLVAAADAAVPAVSAVWGSDWNRQVVVVVPDTQSEMNEVIASTIALNQIAATTYVDSVSAGRALGVRIAVNPANLARLDPVGLRITITHEVTLVATWATKSAATPTWLSEGYAEYVANLGTGQSVAFAASELAADVRAGSVPAALPSTTQFSTDATRLPQIYEQAWLACRLIADRAGPVGLTSFFRAVSGSSVGPDAAVDAALRSVLGVDTATFTAQWQQYLRSVLA